MPGPLTSNASFTCGAADVRARDVPPDLLWDLHIGLGRRLGPEIVKCIADGLEPDLLVDLGGAESLKVILTGVEAAGPIRLWKEWVVPPSNTLATVCALRLRLEATLLACREFDAWVAHAILAVRDGVPVPPRIGRNWS